jgi:protein-S-isoprenylcysteine O-methyltransferase Ste14
MLAICILSMFAVSATYWGNSHPLVEKALFAIGIALSSFGAVGRAWSTAYISGYKLKTLIKAGPYSLCRNPLYFFSMILAVGLGFCTGTVTVPLLIAIVLAILYHIQIQQEERSLSLLFGHEYNQYQQTTPRFFPSRKHFHEPDEIRVSAHVFKRGLLGIGCLLLLIGALELLKACHQASVLPTLFLIY